MWRGVGMVVQQFINRIRNCPLARDIIKKFFIPVIKERKNIEKEVEDILKVLRKIIVLENMLIKIVSVHGLNSLKMSEGYMKH